MHERERNAPPPTSTYRGRTLAYLDPARSGFLRRMARLAGLGCASLSIALALGLVVAGQTPQGRYWRAVGWLLVGNEARTELGARALVTSHPDQNPAYYHLWATSVRRQGRIDDHLEIYARGAAALPESWVARQKHCYYGALFSPPGQAESAVQDSCVAAESLAKKPKNRVDGLLSSAIAAAMADDTEAALALVARAFEQAELHGMELRPAWHGHKSRLEQGENPFLDPETLAAERSRF